MNGHEKPIQSLVRNGKLLYSASSDKSIRVWDVVTGDFIISLVAHEKPIRALTFTSGNLFSISDDATLRQWDGISNQTLQVYRGHVDQGIYFFNENNDL